jgi:hypothetical protein
MLGHRPAPSECALPCRRRESSNTLVRDRFLTAIALGVAEDANINVA